MLSPKQRALANHLNENEGCTLEEALEFVATLDEDEIEREACPCVNGCGIREFSVFTDKEAGAEHQESLESYVDECVLPEIPEYYRFYFDTERWIEDAKMHGRGHTLNSWDGQEHEQKIDGVWYYIYKN